MMGSKKTVISAVVVILVLGALAILYFKYAENKKYEKLGDELIAKVEEYRRQNNTLPNNISELGIIETMGEGPYYEKKDSVYYIVFFNIGFDNTKTYYSKTKKWKDEP